MVKIIEDRDGRILGAALDCALRDGYQWITRDDVARAAGVATGTVNTVYGSMRALKRAVLTAAVEKGIMEIVAQGLADRHEIVMAAPEDVRKAAAAHLLSA